MVKGLDIFREHFREFEGAFTLIGGAACEEWFGAQGLPFRATKDLDLVMMLDQISPGLLAAIRSFLAAGGYSTRERSPGVPVLYRFLTPTQEEFPAKLEFCSRSPEDVDLSDGQQAIPITLELGQHSLSALLLNEAYYGLIQDYHSTNEGLWVATVTALIPLKAHAWLNLTSRKAAGEPVDSKNIEKHRNDVFRLAATLPGEPGPALASSILTDLAAFLINFPSDSQDWPAILASLKPTFGTQLNPADLRDALQTYFRLPAG